MRCNSSADAPDRPESVGPKYSEERHMSGLLLWQDSAETRLPHLALRGLPEPRIGGPAGRDERVGARLRQSAGRRSGRIVPDGRQRPAWRLPIAALAHAVTVYRGMIGHEKRIMKEQCT